MLICPVCQAALNKHSSPIGLFWVCPSCDGRAIALDVVRRAVPRPVVNKLWISARSGKYGGYRRCPACKRPTREVPITYGEETRKIDVCTGCHFVWFDPGEFEDLKQIQITELPELQIPVKVKKALAHKNIEVINIIPEEQEAEESGVSSPEHWWEIVPALFGMPIVYKRTELKHEPIMTWSLSVLIAAISILAFFNLKETAGNWGLIPAEFERYYGLTFLSSFFIHGGIVHLIGNLYFLMVFGSNTEDVLGKERYLILIAASVIIGSSAYILGNADSTIPYVGASAGISGVLTYFCLRFPRASVGLIWRFKWIRLSVGYMFAIWIAHQFLYAYLQKADLVGISALAHLGGVSAGFVSWWITSKPFSGK